MIVFGHEDFTSTDALDNVVFFDSGNEGIYLLMVAGDFYYHRVGAGLQHAGAEVFAGMEDFSTDDWCGSDFEESGFSGDRVRLGEIKHLEHIGLLFQLMDYLS